MRDFAGKVAVVTGSAGGIGRALVERFTDAGMRAVVADIEAPLVEQTTAELRAQGRDVIGVVTDVTEPASLEALRDATLEAFGAVDVLCNNVGVGSASEGQMWEHHVNDWKWSFDVNVIGVINGLNVFLPTMLAQDTDGVIVNTTSGNGGFTPIIQSAVYASTKAALTCVTECLWGQLHELDTKVTAHLLYPSTRTPGFLNTGIWRPGRNRHERYDRPGAPPPDTGRDQLTPFLKRAEAAGQEMPFAPLSEVADLCFEGIRDGVFWMSYPSGDVPTPGSAAASLVRAQSQFDRTPPQYLIPDAPNVMTGTKAGAQD